MPELAQVENTADFIRLLEASNVLTSDQMKIARELAEQTPACKMLARRLIAKGLLTRWQASQLLVGWHKLRLGKYKLCGQLGRGELGRVFLAEHIQLGRQVAIQTLSRRFTDTKQIVDRFLDEARQVAALDHRNIVHVYDIDKNDDQYYLVLEFVEGIDLKLLVRQQGPQSIEAIADILRQASAGLAHAHALGMVHRDVRPENIMVDQQGVVKVLGLGFGGLTEQSRGLSGNEQSEDSETAADYISPEQAMGQEPIDCRADIYSLGCTAYWLLTGRPPFPVGTSKQRQAMHVNKQPPSIGTLRSDAPEDLVAIVDRMMAKSPDDRYASAEQVVAALDQWLESNQGELSGIVIAPMPPPRFESLDATATQTESSGAGFSSSSKSQSIQRSAESNDDGQRGDPTDSSIGHDGRVRWPVLAIAGAGILTILLGLGIWAAFWPGKQHETQQANSRSEASEPPPRQSVHHSRHPKGRKKPPVVRSTMPKPGEKPSAEPKPGTTETRQPDSGNKKGAPAAKKPTEPKQSEPKKTPRKPSDEPSKPKPKTDTTPAPSNQPKPKPKPDPNPKPKPKKPTPPPNPFRQLPASVELPLPKDAPEADVELGALDVPNSGSLNLLLLGKETAIPGDESFRVVPWIDQGTNAWQIQLVSPTEGGAATVARVWIADGTIRFRWDARAQQQPLAQHLINTVLRLRSGGNRHDIRLRESQHVDPLLVNLKKLKVILTINKITAPPEPKQIRFQITSLEDPFPEQYSLDPKDPVALAIGKDKKPVWITIGGDPDEQVLKLQVLPLWRRTLRLECSAYYQLQPNGKPIPLETRRLMENAQVASHYLNMYNSMARQRRADAEKVRRNPDQYKRKKAQLKEAEAHLKDVATVVEKIELLHALKNTFKDGAAIHFRVFYLAGDCEVELLTTSPEEL